MNWFYIEPGGKLLSYIDIAVGYGGIEIQNLLRIISTLTTIMMSRRLVQIWGLISSGNNKTPCIERGYWSLSLRLAGAASKDPRKLMRLQGPAAPSWGTLRWFLIDESPALQRWIFQDLSFLSVSKNTLKQGFLNRVIIYVLVFLHESVISKGWQSIKRGWWPYQGKRYIILTSLFNHLLKREETVPTWAHHPYSCPSACLNWWVMSGHSVSQLHCPQKRNFARRTFLFSFLLRGAS